jgi:hypothetical protein
MIILNQKNDKNFLFDLASIKKLEAKEQFLFFKD